jgi:hypothetical protein
MQTTKRLPLIACGIRTAESNPTSPDVVKAGFDCAATSGQAGLATDFLLSGTSSVA